MEVIKKDIATQPKELVLSSAIQAAVESGLPITLWKLPQSDQVHLIVSYDQPHRTDKLDLEEMGHGFAFSPFDSKQETLFIPADFHVCIGGEESSDFQSPEIASNETETAFLEILSRLLREPSFKPKIYKARRNGDLTLLPDYQKLVESAVNGIQKGQFQKVVPARKIEIELSNDFDPVSAFLDLAEAYPNAFASLVSIPKVGTWMGATPEVLLEVEDQKIFKTVALAATQRRDPDKSPSETAWTQKEIEEQAMVSRYIINCFKKIRLREFEERGPKTTLAGNLLHLKTDYTVDMVETNFPQLGTVMLELLHPTSAVAGMPKEASLEFLKRNEGFDREFFSGFLGPVNVEHKTNLFVNLRCMQLFENSARLYAGAGVTEDSIPEKELIETDMKFNTLLNIIRKQN